MTFYTFILPTSKQTIFYVPPRFLKSETSKRNYKSLMMIFQNAFKHSHTIMSFLKKIQDLRIPEPVLKTTYKHYDVIMTVVNNFQDLTESEKDLKFRVMEFKEELLRIRKKYVVATWRPEDSERLHNEMTVDVSTLLKEHSEIGKLWRQVMAFRK